MYYDPSIDPLQEYEWNKEPYKLTVLVPPRPPRRWMSLKPSTSTRQNAHDIPELPRSNSHADFSRVSLEDLPGLPRKTVVVKSDGFPWDMRCGHARVANGADMGVRGCKEGCYVLEKGGEVSGWKCASNHCEGHVYCGKVMKDKHGNCCFGKKGERLVCLER
ncbi:hypothetical protein J3E72DRAFT_19774 [Bipolaris maydis]|uniref:uncharacterized protein n=1 Tax=Cochliobolus heterostrophus TaxID=5016 RepID=UPI0024CE247A|nr:hypothetical protein J3E73DRAFT_28838 [Bipolaris maydis]KAJ5062144.1 hypothetical protein J3E74DRAFT_39391 [Bipolaris maydis]KAJ6192523.1 hypothetical protein J3E72DRAFT_19774 [Bipolaris maydis]KAJ6215120.1 hypothetical protein PSV09DRAFT_2004568 [Bipolaris maydis]KAJ6276256.1 hypothetical protein PSV08DRAFT_4452 [Bipolaris maydis]